MVSWLGEGSVAAERSLTSGGSWVLAGEAAVEAPAIGPSEVSAAGQFGWVGGAAVEAAEVLTAQVVAAGAWGWSGTATAASVATSLTLVRGTFVSMVPDLKLPVVSLVPVRRATVSLKTVPVTVSATGD